MLDHLGVPVSDFERSKAYAQPSPTGLHDDQRNPAHLRRGSAVVVVSLISISQGEPARPSTSRLPPMTAPLLMPSMRRPSRRSARQRWSRDSPRVP